MEHLISNTLVISSGVLYISTIFFHLVKKNSSVITTYAVQALAVSMILLVFAIEEASVGLLIVALLTFFMKVIFAPAFFYRFIRKNKINFSESSYLSTPLTLIVILLLTILAQSHYFEALANISVHNTNFLILAIAAILVSLFLVINKKGSLTQIIGILSLENCIVAFGVFMGTKQTLGLELGVIVDILVWIIISVIFLGLEYKYFGTTDVTKMNDLKEKE